MPLALKASILHFRHQDGVPEVPGSPCLPTPAHRPGRCLQWGQSSAWMQAGTLSLLGTCSPRESPQPLSSLRPRDTDLTKPQMGVHGEGPRRRHRMRRLVRQRPHVGLGSRARWQTPPRRGVKPVRDIGTFGVTSALLWPQKRSQQTLCPSAQAQWLVLCSLSAPGPLPRDEVHAWQKGGAEA